MSDITGPEAIAGDDCVLYGHRFAETDDVTREQCARCGAPYPTTEIVELRTAFLGMTAVRKLLIGATGASGSEIGVIVRVSDRVFDALCSDFAYRYAEGRVARVSTMTCTSFHYGGITVERIRK